MYYRQLEMFHLKPVVFFKYIIYLHSDKCDGFTGFHSIYLIEVMCKE